MERGSNPVGHLPKARWTSCAKELLAIVLAIHTWGFTGKSFAVVIPTLWSISVTEFHFHLMALVCWLYFCASSYDINVCVIHNPGVCNNAADSLSFPDGEIQETNPQRPATSGSHPCMVNADLHYRILQFWYHGIAQSMRRTYQSAPSKFHSFCCQHSLTPVPVSLTLQRFCTNKSLLVSHKSTKVY